MLKRELDEIIGIALCLAGLAGVSGADSQVAQQSDRARQAAMLLGAADGLLESVAARLPHADRIEYDHITDIIRFQLDEAAFQTARKEGRAMSLEQAVKYALGVDNTAHRPGNRLISGFKVKSLAAHQNQARNQPGHTIVRAFGSRKQARK